MLTLWWRMDGERRQRVWSLYGWFLALMLCGSCFGAVTWAAWMQFLSNSIFGRSDTRGDDSASPSLRFLYLAVAQRWRAAFLVTYAIEFLCLSAAKLMVLDRMSSFAEGSVEKSWAACGRAVMTAVVVCNVVGLAGNIAAAAYFDQTAEFTFAASAALAASDSRSITENIQLARDRLRLAVYVVSLQNFCEVVVLLLIVLAFAVAGIACARRLSSALFGLRALSAIHGAVDAMAAVMQLRRQIVGTTGVVFATFLLQSVYSTMSAVAFKLQNNDVACTGNTQGFCNASCYNVFTHLSHWLTLTPEFQLIVVLIAKPLSLLVALWGMTSNSLKREMLSTDQREMVSNSGDPA